LLVLNLMPMAVFLGLATHNVFMGSTRVRGPDPRQVNMLEYPLHAAAATGDLMMLKSLSQGKGAAEDLYSVDKKGFTPLHWAARFDRFEVVHWLCPLQPHDVFAGTQSLQYETAFDLAARCGAVRSALYLGSGQIIGAVDTSDLPCDKPGGYMDPGVCERQEVSEAEYHLRLQNCLASLVEEMGLREEYEAVKKVLEPDSACSRWKIALAVMPRTKQYGSRESQWRITDECAEEWAAPPHDHRPGFTTPVGNLTRTYTLVLQAKQYEAVDVVEGLKVYFYVNDQSVMLEDASKYGLTCTVEEATEGRIKAKGRATFVIRVERK